MFRIELADRIERRIMGIGAVNSSYITLGEVLSRELLQAIAREAAEEAIAAFNNRPCDAGIGSLSARGGE